MSEPNPEATVEQPLATAPQPEQPQHVRRGARGQHQRAEEPIGEVSHPVASNLDPERHDEAATVARDEAVETMASRYEDNDDAEAARRVRERFQDAPVEQAPGDIDGGPAAPAV